MKPGPNVAWRAERAAEAMASAGFDLDYPRDLISEAMHLAASMGLDPFAEVAAGADHYRAEVHDTGDGTNEDGDTIEHPDPAHECGRYCPREVAA